MSTFRTTIPIGHNDDVPVIVNYEAHRPHRGATDGPGGPKLEPDEPGWIEIDYVKTESGHLLSLSKPDENMLRERIAEYLHELATADRECTASRHAIRRGIERGF
jgi:hypothetical protein